MHKYLEITKDISRAKKFFDDLLAYTMAPVKLNKILNSENDKLNLFNLIDVREYEDYIEGHIPFAQHLPFETIDENLKIITKDKPTIVYAYDLSCRRGTLAIAKLLEHGYPCIELIGGFKSWHKHGYDVVKTDSII